VSWWEAAPVLVVLLLVVLVPGGSVLAVAGLRSLPLAALAAPASAAVLGGSAIVLGLLGVPWGWPAAIGVTVVCAGVAWLLRRWLGAPAAFDAAADARGYRLVAGGVVAALVGGVPLAAGMRTPDRVPQTWDTIFHLNALRYVEETGRASSLLLGGMNDQVEGRGFYPAGWHVLGGTVVDALDADPAVVANLSTLVLAGFVLPMGTALAARVLVPEWPWSAAVGAVVGTSFAAMPSFMASFGTLFPNVWATGSLPAVLAAAVLVLRRPGVLSWAVLLLALGGATLIHPTALFGAGLMGAPFLVTALLRRWHRLLTSGGRPRATAEAAVALVLATAAAVVLATSPVLDAVRLYPRSPFESMSQAVGEALLDAPLSRQGYGVPGASWILGALLVAGIVRATVDPGRRAWVAGHLLAVGAFAVAAGAPADHPLRGYVTGFWYNDPVRLAGQLPVLAAPLVVLGLAAVLGWAGARLRNPAGPRWPAWSSRGAAVVALPAALVAVLLLTGFGYAGKRADRMAFDYWPEPAARFRQLVTTGEAELLRSLDDRLPEEAVVLADPFNGGAFAYALGERAVVFPHVTGTWTDEALDVRASGLDTFDTEACRRLEELGATHLYTDATTYRQGSATQANYAPLDQAPSTGVRLVERVDGAALYEITGCR
jgi:hypothetical protein